MTSPALSRHLHRLRCVECGGAVGEAGSMVRCESCGRTYPIIDATPRMLRSSAEAPAEDGDMKARTAESFAYEWQRFGRPRSEWRRNFLDYMQPHGAEDLRGLTVLDVGAGSGRHAREAALLGAEVVAVDRGAAIEVARKNVPETVLTVEADAEALPIARDAFDLVLSIGVLHHLADPGAALRRLVEHVRPGGHLHVYLYWQPPHRSHRLILRGVSIARRLTTRLPHPLLHLLCYPLAALLWAFVVVPYGALRRVERLHAFADLFPLKTYADYPFGVLVNDQFDRFSAPIEHRFTGEEVEAMLTRAGLEDVRVIAHHGWIGDGRKPPAAPPMQES